MTALVESWWAWIAAVSLQATALAVVVWALDRGTARWLPASVRGWFHAVVLLRLLLPPDLSSPIGLGQLGLDVAVPAIAGTGGTPWFFAWVGSVALLATLALCDYRRRARRLRCGERPLDAGWRAAATNAARRLGRDRPPPTWFVEGDHSPCVVGVLRGRTLLPRTFAAAVAPGERELVLLHEYVHLQRRDPLRALAVVAVQVLFWFHPVVWLTSRRLRELRELACDERAVAVLGGDQGPYRRALLRAAAAIHLPTPMRPHQPAWLGARGELIARLEALTRPPHGRRARVAGAVLLAGLLFCCVPMARAARPFLAGVDPGTLPGCLLQRYLVFDALARSGEPR